jgi:hypothetical protein
MIPLLTTSETISIMGSVSAIFHGLSSTAKPVDDGINKLSQHGHFSLDHGRATEWGDLEWRPKSTAAGGEEDDDDDDDDGRDDLDFLWRLKLHLVQHSASLLQTFTYTQLVDCLVYASRFGVGLPLSWLQAVQGALQSHLDRIASESAEDGCSVLAFASSPTSNISSSAQLGGGCVQYQMVVSGLTRILQVNHDDT